ncbi:MAG: C45 family peptidase [Myxococcota bacterium]
MKVFEYDASASPRTWGQAHGEAFRPMIAELARIRLELCVTIGGFDSEDEVLALARAHGPVVAEFDADLSEELRGIAEGAAIDLGRLIVLNHYTDIRDIRASTLRTESAASEECSAVYARTGDRPVLGQTWDMHGSAEPYVLMLGIPARDSAPAAWVFSITGCVGMTGLNGAGVGITINNLKSTDAQVGIVWPALVRRALQETSAVGARDVVLEAPLGSGHHYLVADAAGAYGIETSGTVRALMYHGKEPQYVHTNHCIDPVAAARNVVSATSTTKFRYDTLETSLASSPIESRADLFARLGDHTGYPRSVCTHMASPEAPHAMKTCGGLVMDLEGRDVWAAAGCLHRARPHTFGF